MPRKKPESELRPSMEIIEETTEADPYSDEDFYRCLRYLELREMNPSKPRYEDVAQEMGISRDRLGDWIRKWENSGLLAACRTIVMAPALEDIRSVNDRVAKEWPVVVDNLLRIAQNRAAPRAAIEAYDRLQRDVIAPMLEAQEGDDGSPEKRYLLTRYKETIEERFNPLTIPGLVTPAAPAKDE